MSATRTAREQITAELTTWPGVTTAGPGERGEFSFLLGRHEIGHLHGDHAAHFAFKRQLGTELRQQGRVTKHPITDSPGLAARRIEGPDDVLDVIELLRLNYERIVGAHGLPGAGTRPEPEPARGR